VGTGRQCVSCWTARRGFRKAESVSADSGAVVSAGSPWEARQESAHTDAKAPKVHGGGRDSVLRPVDRYGQK
jgi:hypothetical protein